MAGPSFTWNVDPVLVHGGATPLRWYAVFFAATVVGGYFIWRWQMLRGGHPESLAARYLGYAVAGVIVGARVVHCLFYDLELTLSQPLFIFQVWRGGLASHGALVGLAVATAIYARRSGLSFAEVGDRGSISFALATTLVRAGNFFNSEIVGRLTDQTWGVRFPHHDGANAPLRHPSQLYEVALGLVVLALLFTVDRRLGEARRQRGLLSALFLVSYFAGRIAVERFKAYQTLDAAKAPLTMGQWLSVVPLLVGAVWLAVVIVRARRARADAGATPGDEEQRSEG